MKPQEFWALTPIEVLDFAEAQHEGSSFMAWLAAAYQRVDKFPKKPGDLFKKAGSDGAMDILSQAKAMKMMQESDKRLASRRKKPVTRLSEE